MNIDYETSLGSGTVSTNGTAVTWVSGTTFVSGWSDIHIGSHTYPIASVNSSTSITLTTSAGIQTGAAFAVPSVQPLLQVDTSNNVFLDTLGADWQLGLSSSLGIMRFHSSVLTFDPNNAGYEVAFGAGGIKFNQGINTYQITGAIGTGRSLLSSRDLVNDTTSGMVQGNLACLGTSGKGTRCTSALIANGSYVGVAVDGVFGTTAGNTKIATGGQTASLIFDGSTTIGDCAVPASNGYQAHDLGSSSCSGSSSIPIGLVDSANGGTGTAATVLLFPPGITPPPVQYSVSWTPAAATVSTCTAQTVTVTGLVTTKTLTVSPPSDLGVHLWIGNVLASAANTASVAFCSDATGGTPSSGTWLFRQ